jgi:hypothetical protein
MELEHTLNELRGRMTPGHVFDEVWEYARKGQIRDFVGELGYQVRSNPLPVALVGTGLAWLMLARRAQPHDSSDGESRFRRAGEELADTAESMTGRAQHAVSSAAASTSETVGAARDRVRSTYHDARDAYRDARDATAETASRVRDTVGGAASRTADMGRRVVDRTSSAFEDHPLVFGALGLALGAAFAAMFPASRLENRVAGKASDEFKREAGDIAEKEVDKVANVAERTLDEAARAAEEENLFSPSQQEPAKPQTGEEEVQRTH